MKILLIKKNKFYIPILIIVFFIGILLTFKSIHSPAIIPTFSNLSTNEARVNYLKSFGWIVNAEPYEIKSLIIPTEFNSVYNNYNELQKTQNFDLTKYKGLTVKKYTYEVENYPKENIAFATLYIHKDKVIAADIYTTGLNGIMHGLTYANEKAG